ncbi:phenylalanine ammonia-lyase [Aspergillus sclerotioniger CBS 115572]|uniref:Phenylalanine ammonia-lyase n=1 Tax=Aspergillus sclerotioniger CBS 115572 TaxID=1450535 RepID=A0A317X4D1_9EURO|nr:phenylalanine ammonia-lyase [Aspergillus sclerotioniger CBS 115572]PWY93433.1 phenylalanine ammonia-lyase [Aspergillus sclerotioniger CBS 115572]
MLNKYIPEGHLEATTAHWSDLQKVLRDGELEIDGNGLTLAGVVAVARYGCQPRLTDKAETIDAINESVVALAELIRDGNHIYGVNTGFGGSADSRTNQTTTLQSSLLQLLQSGILTDSDTNSKVPRPNAQGPGPHSMPSEWVKATMLVRSNSVARGHSAVSVPVISAIIRLLREDITPVIPLRGTISASGDLMPLAYVVGAIEGSPGISVRVGGHQIVTAQQALQAVGAKGVTLGPKEGLGLVNGTAASGALAGLVLYETHQLAVLAQAVTALTVEAIQGSVESFHPFIAQVRPHAGQIEAAENILSVLRGSQLVRGSSVSQTRAGLVQDRYSLRTASQWIGPQLEDLLLADRQVSVELNSTSDNPLIDAGERTFYTGGNFQATSITSAMEKTRLALQMFGKIMFVQCNEMIDPNLNNGLPTNLVADDPSLSFTMKGVDINMAAYMSELAYLANPVSTHVQAAEMQNQALNSLAFLSARYTMKAVDIVSMMGACSLYVACQALDLRVLQLTFFQRLQQTVTETTKEAFERVLEPREIDTLAQHLFETMKSHWPTTSRLDLRDRCERVVEMTLPVFFGALVPPHRQDSRLFAAINVWKTVNFSRLEAIYRDVLAEFCASQPTAEHLGVGTKAVYTSIRHDLGIPFHQGFIEHPSANYGELPETINGRAKKTVGGWISVVYEALRDGTLSGTILSAFKQ